VDFKDSRGSRFSSLWQPMAPGSWPLNKKIAGPQAKFEAWSIPGLEARVGLESLKRGIGVTGALQVRPTRLTLREMGEFVG
jgi:hypothetical protein